MDRASLEQKTRLSVHEAALLIAPDAGSVAATEVRIARAIEHGNLPADIFRWATEQWHGDGLPGNIDRQRTFVERCDLDAWRAHAAPPG